MTICLNRRSFLKTTGTATLSALAAGFPRVSAASDLTTPRSSADT
ncbi:MAG: twin-arginine translocation signal domain-containing protein, partial [Candidatus Omnitrophica bacterium]|nr:twin-arginine translocation signal domain-containing protein [Candidatus Omnitrophota bacterium]